MQTLDTPEDLADGDEDFAELEAIINPGKPKPDAGQADDPEEGFEELEALLGEAMEEAKLAATIKKARAKAKSGYKLADEDLERIRRWELANEWRAVANVALFHRYACACGNHQTVYEGQMLESRHKTQADTTRWTRQLCEDPKLPKKTAIRKSYVPMCQRCSAASGYSLVTDLEWSA